MIDENSSLIDVAFETCSALARAEILAILCGGSAATFYCAAYQSLDADFVLRFESRARAIDSALAEIGFARNASNVYTNARTKFTVEFPAGPLTIGRKIVSQWKTVRRSGCILHVISVEDCIADRFLHFWAWGDRSARKVALQVAHSAIDIDIALIEKWAESEMAMEPFYDRRAWAAFRAELPHAP